MSTRSPARKGWPSDAILRASHTAALSGWPRQALPLPASPHPACTPILTVQAFYAAVNALSVARGHDPDMPPHLNKVTETV